MEAKISVNKEIRNNKTTAHPVSTPETESLRTELDKKELD